ncbi:MAG: serine/threonine-protein phosphatase [Phycisphaerales bacterium]|nr:serine/threonine-protein phosphatase [Phycisphaerales bacterium]
MLRAPRVRVLAFDETRAALFESAARRRGLDSAPLPAPDLNSRTESAGSNPQHGAASATFGSSSIASDTTRPAASLHETATARLAGLGAVSEVALIITADPNAQDRIRSGGSGRAPASGPLTRVGGAGVTPAAALDLGRIVDSLSAQGMPVLVWGQAHSVTGAGGNVEFAPPETAVDELIGRLLTLSHYGPMVARLEREIEHLERLGRQLNRYFAEVDQELRLAGRLQRDFLPNATLSLPGLHCAALYQPATWVSGDLYDFFRIGEHHAGVFLADAMGHGLAAGIMTMFLRQTLHGRPLEAHSPRIERPAEALALLHEALARQNLPSQNFVTAVYGTIDTRTHELRVSRGGHPYPVLVSAAGELRELTPEGPLLGVPDMPAEFDEVRVTLSPGDKLILYTDGLEEILLLPAADSRERPSFAPLMHELAPLGAAAFIEALQRVLDRREGSLHQADDMTIVVVERF